MTKHSTLSSAVYEGRVTHSRHSPYPHVFSYRMAQLCLDLDELDSVFAGRWLWSTRRPALAEWRRTDYLQPHDRPLAQAVRERIAAATGATPAGPIRLLTHLRYAGYVFNPVSFYYCYQSDRVTLDCIVAEITNTPWGERYAYVLTARDATLVLRVTLPPVALRVKATAETPLPQPCLMLPQPLAHCAQYSLYGTGASPAPNAVPLGR